jgi:acetoin utilization deacetylase AcuC-like enzyme
MTCDFITHADCLRHEMGPDHPECPSRLAAIHDRLLGDGLLNLMGLHDAPLATEAQLLRVHTPGHIARMLALAPAQGYAPVDPDTCMNPHSVTAALRAAGAAVLATDLVLGGDVSAAFCAVRPPGHHAERDAAMGFCFFNNVAVAVRHAIAVHGIERVLLADFDVHHGNGSQDVFQDDPQVLMCSVYEKGLYPFADDTTGANMVNVGLPARSGGQALREAVLHHWLPAIDRFQPQLVVVSAGFDGHRLDDMGNLGLVEDDYRWVTRELVAVAGRHAAGRLVSCLEGGYHLPSLARSVAAHVRVLLGAD